MTEADWLRVVREARNLGCNNLVLIGGEPTLDPSFEAIIRETKAACVRTEVFSNLLSVSERHWNSFLDCNVSLATSFYTADSAAHDQVTQRAGSYRRTLTNIERAVSKNIALRVGLIKASDTDDDVAACDLLRSVGVTSIGFVRVRGVGRGGQAKASCVDELRGACADNRLAIVPDGPSVPILASFQGGSQSATFKNKA